MQKTYGNKRKSNPIPDSYNQSIELIITPTDVSRATAWGTWSSKGFLLKYGSLIIEDDKNEQYIKDIKKELEKDDMLEYNEGLNDYSLCGDIYLHAPSTAAALVIGHNSNGYIDWKNTEGVKLGHLLWPDNPDYS